MAGGRDSRAEDGGVRVTRWRLSAWAFRSLRGAWRGAARNVGGGSIAIQLSRMAASGKQAVWTLVTARRAVT